jgi:spore coat polysaccharide biosynthesis protein SpsF
MITAIIQARTASSRLPQKVLKELPYGSGISALAQVIRRTKQSRLVEKIIVATTTQVQDDPILDIAEAERTEIFRGSSDNVLQRYYQAARETGADQIVRITSDCPCIDPGIIDLIIEEHLAKGADYTSNAFIRSYPDGLDVEVIKFSALEKAYQQATTKAQKEHVTDYIQESPHLFNIVDVVAPEELKMPERRITLDTIEDYALLCMVFDFLYHRDPYFDAKQIMKLFISRPWLDLVNRKETVGGKKAISHV